MPILLHKGKYAIANLLIPPARMWRSPARCLEACNPRRRSQLRAPLKEYGHRAAGAAYFDKGPENIGMVVMTITNNPPAVACLAANMRDTAAICKKYKIHLNIDAARFAENAMFVAARAGAPRHVRQGDHLRLLCPGRHSP